MDQHDELILPGGYWAAHVAGAWYLFNPRDVLLAGPADAATAHRHAWCDAWRRIDRELKDEVAAFRDGTRSPQDLPNLSQLVRAWDAVAKSGSELKEPAGGARGEAGSAPQTPESLGGSSRWWRATLAASAVIAALVTAVLQIGPERYRPTVGTIEHKRAEPASAVIQKRPSSTPHQAIVAGTATSPHRMKAGVPSAASHVRRPARTAYVVVVGTFESSGAAEDMKRLVRRKGYVVDVVPHGASSEVMTRPMRTRMQAEYVARGLEAVGLQAQLMVWGEQ
ncbi:MAG TPA: hypothetical protein VJT33_06880 [bacterium]|nr:hypothetical protein [bacterium]